MARHPSVDAALQTRGGGLTIKTLREILALLVAISLVSQIMGCDACEALRPVSYSPIGIDVSDLVMVSKSETPESFKPRRDLPAWDVTLPIDWAADPFTDRNWQFQLHAWRAMDFHLNKYRETEDVTWLKGAIEIALDWERFHIELAKPSTYQWHDMATGIRASRLAFLLDRVFSNKLEIDDADLATLMRLVDLHAVRLQEPEFLARGNHALRQLIGLDTLCEVAHWRRACLRARPYARTEFIQLIRRQFTSQDVHIESSPAYHRYVLRVLRETGAIERFGHADTTHILARAAEITPWLTYPNGATVAVGDSAGTGPVLEAPVEPVCLTATSCWAVRDLTQSGYAVIRSLPETPLDEASLLFVSAMAHVTGHKHADDLGFVLMEGGRQIFVDSGKYGYNRDAPRRYVQSARAHNVPSLANRPIGPKDLDVDTAEFGPIQMNDHEFMVGGSVNRPGLFRHKRAFHYAPGIALIIKDRLHNQTDARWLSNLHLVVGLVPNVVESGFTVRVGDRIIRAEFQGVGCQLIVTVGDTEPYQGWVSTGYLSLVPAYVVSASCPAGLVESEWRIDLDAEE